VRRGGERPWGCADRHPHISDLHHEEQSAAKEGEEIAFAGATSGSLKLMGYKGSEIIIAK